MYKWWYGYYESLKLDSPPLFGFDGLSSHTAAGVVAVQVLVASFGGAWGYRKGNYLHKPLITYMGISILIGSLIGGFGAKLLSEQIINIIYGVLALIAVVMMFIPTKDVSDEEDPHSFNKWIASTSAFLVGIGAGIVGAGGAFLLVPIMLSVFHIPTRVTIASSLAITVISSIGAVTGKLFSGDVPLFPAVVVAVASAIASVKKRITRDGRLTVKQSKALISLLHSWKMALKM